MNKQKFLELLKNFNGGILRGSQRKLAKELDVDESYIANLRNNRQAPSEKLLKEMSKILKISEKNLQEIFEVTEQVSNVSNEKMELLEEKLKRHDIELTLLKKEIENLKSKQK